MYVLNGSSKKSHYHYNNCAKIYAWLTKRGGDLKPVSQFWQYKIKFRISFLRGGCSRIKASFHFLSSPRAKRAGPKSPRAESARAVTGRRCPHSGRGEDFLSRQPDFFRETAVTPERKVEKSFPRWEINRHVEG